MPGRCNLNKPQTRSRVRKPQPWVHEAGHRSFVASLGCCVCGNRPCDAAHVRKGTDGAMGRKPSDRHCVPLCNPIATLIGVHQGGIACHPWQHQVGEDTFWADVNGDPLDLAAKLWSLSRKYSGDDLIERGKYAVREWRSR